MGQATNDTKNRLVDDHPYGMWARLYVRDRTGNNLHVHFQNATFEPGGRHVEEVLLDQLRGMYGQNYAGLPNDCTVIIVCRFSPCKQCTNVLIPAFMAHFANRNVIVKFKFIEYYSVDRIRPEYFNPNVMWQHADLAQNAYDQLSQNTGIAHICKDISWFKTVEKHSFKLVISWVGKKGSYETITDEGFKA